ncbi:MAG: class I SAM-dependent methyltransferase [Azospirillum brasilense]|nr:MAG: class I SAM-dependent methyltransferase [Azospirillum brasilense]
MVLSHQKDSAIEKLFVHLFKQAHYGTLQVTTPSGHVHMFTGPQPGPSIDFHIHDWKAIRYSLMRGDIGFGEAYIEDLWSTSDLGDLFHYMVLNFEPLEKVVNGHRWVQQLFRVVNWMRRNTKKNSKLNIRSHYDVGNDFYKLWLDETMTYSSALYAGQPRTLAEAQHAKYARIIEKLQPLGHILEIGCGWGGFAEDAAKAGHRLTGLTLSPSQLEFAQNRMARLGLDDKVTLKLVDYRDEKDSYDAIVSIEMFEAVGEQYWPVYFKAVKDRLKQGGRAVIQTITIDDAHFEGYRARSDFIRHYTFPGGLLPSVAKLREQVALAGLQINEVFSFGLDYAQTLQEWLDRIDAREAEIKALGYTDAFLRSWRFYIGCCIGAFRAGRTDVVQLDITHVS